MTSIDTFWLAFVLADRIVAVNDSAIAGVKMSTEDIMKRLRGPKGSKVNLTAPSWRARSFIVHRKEKEIKYLSLASMLLT